MEWRKENRNVRKLGSVYLIGLQQKAATNLLSVREFGYNCLLYSLDGVLRYGDVLNIIQTDETDRVVERKEVQLFDNQAFREALINDILYNKWVQGNEPKIKFSTEYKHGGTHMEQWVNVTDTFSESRRHYKNTYLEICEVFGGEVEVSLFSSEDAPYEIYFSFGIMYGIVYAEREEADAKREQMKADLEQEYLKNKEPSDEFINSFAKKFDVCLPSDVLFDEDALMKALLDI